MARVCPHCHYESPVDSDFCPACGAPMDEAAAQRRAVNEYINAAALPMKWHKFQIYFSLPLSMLMAVYGLFTVWPEMSAADFSRVSPDIVSYVRLALYLALAVQLALLPVLIYTEINLIRLRWRGVRALLCLYAAQVIFAAAEAYLMRRIGEAVPMDVVLSAAEEAALFFLCRAYYRKRRALFSPGNDGI